MPSALILALLLSVIHFFSYKFAGLLKKYRVGVISLSTGIFITFIFIQMIPELYEATTHTNEVFLFALFGFILFYLIEEYFYKHAANKRELKSKLQNLDLAGFFITSFIMGYTLVLFSIIKDISYATILFFPLVMHSISSAISFDYFYSKRNFTSQEHLILASAPLLGALLSFVLILPLELYYLIFSFVIGVFIFIVIKDLSSKDKKGEPVYFMAGVILMIFMLLFLGKI